MSKEHHIPIIRRLRYYSAGGDNAPNYLMALHGYSQHPKFFLRKFEELASDQLRIVAPEGLHRFYISGHSGRVGASWMTKEDRLIDIEDNSVYLNSVFDQTANKDAFRMLMGFSQGAATAVRFFCATNGLFDRLILWAGSFPPDLSLPENKEMLNTTGVDLVIGDQDEFIKEKHIVELQSLFDQEGINYRMHRYSGGHDIDVGTLKDLLSSF